MGIKSEVSRGRWVTNNDKINTTYQRNKHERTAIEEPPWRGQKNDYWRVRSLNQLYSREASRLYLMQYQMSNIWSVCIWVLCETSQWNAHNQKHCTLVTKQSQGLNGEVKPVRKKPTNRTIMTSVWSDVHSWSHIILFWRVNVLQCGHELLPGQVTNKFSYHELYSILTTFCLNK